MVSANRGGPCKALEGRMHMNDYQQYRPGDGYQSAPRFQEPVPLSAMAVTALVLGIIALLTSFLPIVNNISFLFALLGIIFGIVAVVATVRGTRRGKPLAISALVINVIAVVVVLATQAMFSAAIDEATSGPSVTGTSVEQGSVEPSATEPSSEEPKADYSNLAIGTAAELDDGLTVCVQSVETGLENYDGSAITGVTVSYTNNGSSEAPFNLFDWKAQDAQGAQRNTTYYSEATEELSSGTLAPGGTVTGKLYFDGDVSKVLYYSNMFYDSSVAWAVA